MAVGTVAEALKAIKVVQAFELQVGVTIVAEGRVLLLAARPSKGQCWWHYQRKPDTEG